MVYNSVGSRNVLENNSQARDSVQLQEYTSQRVKGNVEYRSRALMKEEDATEVSSALGGYAAKAP